MKFFKPLKTILFFFLLITLLAPTPAKGEVGLNELETQSSASSTCDVAQFVFMIDFSGSMDRNDATGLRFTGPVHMADVLASNYLSARLVSKRLNRPKKLEFAVVQFASSARVVLDWTTIAPADYVAWQDQRAEIASAVELGRSEEERKVVLSTIGNGTDHFRAFEKVIDDLLGKKDLPVDGCPERTIILMTDGLPDNQGEPLLGDELDSYMLGAEIENGRANNGLINLIRNNLGGIGDRVYVTGINNSQDNYWRLAEKDWQAVTCDSNRNNPDSLFWKQIACDESQWDSAEPARAEKVNNPPELGLRLDKIVAYRLGSGITIVQPGKTTIPPYLERVLFNFYKPSIDNLVELRDPNGRLLTCDGLNVLCEGITEGIQTIQIIRPIPGKYELSTTAKSDDYVITRELIFAQGSLSVPDQKYQQFSISPIKINLVDSEGKALPDYGDNYRLLVDTIVTPPLDSGKDPYPISLTDTGKSSLEGSFTPLYGGDNHLSIHASVIDDDGQKWDVIQSPFADFDLLVDPVSLAIEQAVSDRAAAGCALVQFTPFSLSIKTINVQTNEPAVISLPIKWDIRASQGVTVENISAPGSNQKYTLKAVSNQAGDQNITITASVPDPQNAAGDIGFGKQTVALRFTPGHYFQFGTVEISPSADIITTGLENMRRALFGGKEPGYLIIGRRFFFFKPGIDVNAQIIESGTNNTSISPDQIPSLSFQPEKGGEIVHGGGWESGENNNLRSYTDGLALGCYAVQVDPTAPYCEATLDVSQISGKSICLVPGISERLLEALSLLSLVSLLIYMGNLFICKISNPLTGYLAILPMAGGKANWHNGIFGWSCWDFRVQEPEKNGLITRVRVRGALLKRGTFTLRYYTLSPDGKKNSYEDIECDLNNWKDIILKTGYKIIWRRTENEFLH